MNAGILPLALLFAATGLMLSRVSQTAAAWRGFAGLAATAFIAALLPVPDGWQPALFILLWLSVAATAALAIFSPVRHERLALPAAINAGVWAGALASISSNRGALILAFPLGLVFVPGRWLSKNGYGIAVKVAASWVMAIAMLAFFVTLTPTPGYEPDHME